MKEIASNFELEINKNFSELSEEVEQAITGGCAGSCGMTGMSFDNDYWNKACDWLRW